MFTSKFIHSQRTILAVGLLLFGSAAARAHGPGLSAAEVRIAQASVEVTLSIALSDVSNVQHLDLERDAPLTRSNLSEANRLRFEEFARNWVELWIADQRLAPTAIRVLLDGAGGVDFRISFDRPSGPHIKFRFPAMKRFSRGHRQYVSFVNEQGNKLAEKMLDASVEEFDLEINPSSPSSAPSLRQFFELGIEHILTGHDHLVFLLGLLLAGAAVRNVVKIITSFTAAHSITLALSVFDLVRIPAGVVEPLIAISIVYVGLENIFRRGMEWRWLVTFGFGLIHGFGFASALQDLGIGSGARAALPLLSFNLGVEAGQLVIAIVVLPLIWGLQKRPVFVRRIAPVCSILVSIAGGFWLVERMA